MKTAMRNKEESFGKLTKEQWIVVAQSLISSCETLCAGLQKVKDNEPSIKNTQYDPDVYAENISFAVAAIAYVAEYAVDKCLFGSIDTTQETEDEISATNHIADDACGSWIMQRFTKQE